MKKLRNHDPFKVFGVSENTFVPILVKVMVALFLSIFLVPVVAGYAAQSRDVAETALGVMMAIWWVFFVVFMAVVCSLSARHGRICDEIRDSWSHLR